MSGFSDWKPGMPARWDAAPPSADRDTAVTAMLEENERRRDQLFGHADQLTGEGLEGPRVRMAIPDYRFPVVWLPAELAQSPSFRAVAEAGSIEAYVERLGEYCPLSAEQICCYLDNLRMAADPYYAFAAAFRIKDKLTGQMRPFILNHAQRLLLDRFERMRREGRPIRLVLLKARQWGGSTLVQLYMAWIQLFLKSGWNSMIVAQTKDTARRIKAMYAKVLLHFPEQVFCRGGLKFTPMERSASDSVISDGHGRPLKNNVITVCSYENYESTRGADCAMAHFSEVAYWRTTPQKSAAGLIRAVTSGMAEGVPLTMEVMESTANGKSGYFYDEYQEAKAGLSAREALFIPFFFIENDMLPFDDNRERADFARRLFDGRFCTSVAGKTEEPGAYLWSLWLKGATLEHIKWYVERRKSFHSHGQMASEAPSDDVECFTFSGHLLIAADRIQEVENRVKSHPIWRGGINITTCELSGSRDERGPFKIWEFPGTADDEYLVAVDVGSYSERSDWSVITVIRRGGDVADGLPLWSGQQGRLPSEPVRVVARWREHVRYRELAWTAVAVARFYRNALLVFESNTFEKKTGEAGDFVDAADHSLSVLDEVKDRYDHLYIRNTSGPDDLREGRAVKVGFHTNRKTKQLMVDHFTTLFESGAFLDPDEEFYKELAIYEQRPDGSYGNIAGYGNHDDIVMSDMIAAYVNTVQPRYAPLRRTSRLRSRGTCNESLLL